MAKRPRDPQQPALEVDYVGIDELVPYARNAKLHPDEQVDAIAASIARFGECDPVGVWTRPDGRLEIVEGHGRILALKKLGRAEVPIIRLDHLDDDARRAYTHIHNQTTMSWGFDTAVLAADMAELPDFEWGEFGFEIVRAEDFGTDFDLPDADAPQFKTASLHLTGEQYEVLAGILEDVDRGGVPDAGRQRMGRQTHGDRAIMGRALDIQLRVVPARIARPFIEAHHYSHKAVNNSQLHLGAFLDGALHGVMSFGPPLDKSKVIGLVEGTPWNGMLELNRMAFDEALPRNSESRCLGVAMRLIKKNAPQVKWVLSFADACSCGDGAIYRASNFILTGIKRNRDVARLPSGEEIHHIALKATCSSPRKELGGRSYFDITGGRYDFDAYCKATGAEVLDGWQLRYIYFIDKAWHSRLTVPEIPFSEIEARGATMYRGVRGTGATSSTPGAQPGDGGASPTVPLHHPSCGNLS